MMKRGANTSGGIYDFESGAMLIKIEYTSTQDSQNRRTQKIVTNKIKKTLRGKKKSEPKISKTEVTPKGEGGKAKESSNRRRQGGIPQEGKTMVNDGKKKRNIFRRAKLDNKQGRLLIKSRGQGEKVRALGERRRKILFCIGWREGAFWAANQSLAPTGPAKKRLQSEKRIQAETSYDGFWEGKNIP